MKFLIVGRTGTGKDKLRSILEKEYGWKFVLSHTTRPKRYPDEDTHIFITQEEAAHVPAQDKVAVTFIKNDKNNTHEYFTTRQQVEKCDAYIIDPIGIQTLLAHMSEEPFEIIYLAPKDKETQKRMAIGRSDNPEEAEKTFQYRYDNEDAQFTAFEKSLENNTFGGVYCRTAQIYINDYTEDTIKDIAFRSNGRKQFFENMNIIIEESKKNQSILTNCYGDILVHMKNKDNSKTIVPQTNEQFALTLASDPDGFSKLLQVWLEHRALNTERNKK